MVGVALMRMGLGHLGLGLGTAGRIAAAIASLLTEAGESLATEDGSTIGIE